MKHLKKKMTVLGMRLLLIITCLGILLGVSYLFLKIDNQVILEDDSSCTAGWGEYSPCE